MKCQKCGSEIKGNMKFCNKCGAKVTAEPPVMPTEPPILPTEPIKVIEEEKPQAQNIVAKNTTVAIKKTVQIPPEPPKKSNEGVPVQSQNVGNNFNDAGASVQSNQQYVPVNPVSPVENNVAPKTKNKEKNKYIAGALALVLGHIAVHWFYLGRPLRAILYIVIEALCIWIYPPLLAIYMAFYVAEGIFFLCAKKETFEKYVNWKIIKKKK